MGNRLEVRCFNLIFFQFFIQPFLLAYNMFTAIFSEFVGNSSPQASDNFSLYELVPLD